jgi:phosphoribosyl-ATP pyrophosphohydrolase/phosphoribosyl-AMP cyclohydrolase
MSTSSSGLVAAVPLASSASALLSAVKFDERGLVTVVVADRASGVVRMVAWANQEALTRTVASGKGVFWSRSRGALWEKGETSGNALCVRELRVDCDADVVLYLVDADGPSCHTGETSCFFRRLDADGSLVEDHGPAAVPASVIDRVADVIRARRRERPEKSYVVSLLDAGWPKILGKLREESGELAEALPEGDAVHTAHEAADLVFHMLVGLEAAGVPTEEIYAQLRKRFGVSGIDEKASRQPKAPERG